MDLYQRKNNNIHNILKILNHYSIYILLVLIIIFGLILVLDRDTTRQDALKVLESYIIQKKIVIKSGEEQYFSFDQINYKLNTNCYEGGGILVRNINGINQYNVYYICDGEHSTDLYKLYRQNSEAKQMHLNGLNLIYIKVGYDYIDDGYNVMKDNVIVKTSGTVGNNVGMYLLTYTGIDESGIEEKVRRIVLRTNKNFESNPIIRLKEDNDITLVRGRQYDDPGYQAFDYNDGDITNKVKVEGLVDINKVGNYKLKYSVINSNGLETTTIRNVRVVADFGELKVKTTISPSTITNSNVNINFKISGDGFSFFLDPDDNLIKDTNYNYVVSKNGTYTFTFKKKNGLIEKKEIVVSNIDTEAPNGNCLATITDNNTSIEVVSNDSSGMAEYSYIVNSSLYTKTTNNKININREINTVDVILTDKVGNAKTISCSIDNQAFTKESFYSQTESYNGLNYVIFMPKKLYSTKKNPLIIYLHGSGEFGSNINNLVKGSLFVKRMHEQTFEGAVFIAPQSKRDWASDLTGVKGLIDYAIEHYNVDPNRISLTGYSAGAIALYEFISNYPNILSVAVPVSGGSKVDPLKLIGTKIRAYHGTNDTNVSFSFGNSTISRIKNAGGDAEMVSFKGMGHNIQSLVYDSKEIMTWIIAQKR